MAMVSTVEKGKQIAAHRAVDENIFVEHKVIGIGSGSTVVYAVERISNVPNSITLSLFQPVSKIREIDVTIDGADEVNPQLNAIKGGGACQFQEMVVAKAAKKFVMIADYRKKSDSLGVQWTKGVPIEVVPLAYKVVMNDLNSKLSIKPQTVKLRMAVQKAGPVVTDNGNFVIDAHFGPIAEPRTLGQEIKLLTGVVEVGLFCGLAEIAYFGEQDGSVDIWKRK
ncbi:unnamed protein product [Umbelopsis vinacea]